MTKHILSWSIGHDALGPLLETAVEEMNRHGPFEVGDPVVATAPRWTELVGGGFRVMAPSSGYHSVVVTEVTACLRSLVDERGLVASHAPVRTSKRTLREADVAVYLGRTPEDFQGTAYPSLIPHLVVEVLSPSTAAQDRGEKKAEYEAVGVKEYYLLDPENGAVEAYALVKGRYSALRPDASGQYRSKVLKTTWTPAQVLD